MRTLKLPFTERRISLIYLSVFLVVSSISIGAFASSVTITNSNYAGVQGVYLQANGYYSVTNANYNVVAAAQSATTPPLAWSNGAVGYVNALVAGDWALSYTLTINAGGLTSHTYTITVSSTSSSGSTSSLYTFQFTSPSSISAGQTMTIIWDTGSTSWTGPAALEITIA
jgi:hypothetical protein